MTDLQLALLVIFSWINGIILGYIIWSPETPFKKGLIDGMTLKFLWRRK